MIHAAVNPDVYAKTTKAGSLYRVKHQRVRFVKPIPKDGPLSIYENLVSKSFPWDKWDRKPKAGQPIKFG